ncbi:MAG: hypothetical protein AAFU64_13220, partial [Bacteroidota bacterium]
MKISQLTTYFYFFFFSISLWAQEPNYREKYSPDSLQSWTSKLMQAVAKGHPGMYRYTPKTSFDSLIQAQILSIKDSLSTLEYYRKLKPLFAKIGCLHTSVNLSGPFQEYYEKKLKLIPIEIFIAENQKVYITKDYSPHPKIPLKSELISINGQTIPEILTILYQAIPSDGYNRSLKTLLLNHRFAFWYQSMISTQDQFDIEVKVEGQVQKFQKQGVDKGVFPDIRQLEGLDQAQLTFEKREDYAYLRIRSFAKSTIKKNG